MVPHCPWKRQNISADATGCAANSARRRRQLGSERRDTEELRADSSCTSCCRDP